MHSHARLLQRVIPCVLGWGTCGPLRVGACVDTFSIWFSAADKTFGQFLHLQLDFFHLLHYCLLVFSSFFFLTRTSFLGLCMPPIPHFLLFHLVWLWGLGCRDNGGHRPVSILFAKFLLLQAYCAFAAGIGKSLAPPSPTHTLSQTCRRERVLRNINEIWISSCNLYRRFWTCTAVKYDIFEGSAVGHHTSFANINI